MKHIFRALLSPMAFAIGFLWPLITQTMVALGYFEPGWNVIMLAALIALPIGLMAQLRGSWIWIK